MKKIKRIFTTALLCFLLNGCVGALTIEELSDSGSHELLNDYIKRHPEAKDYNVQKLTKKDVISLWGEPDKKVILEKSRNYHPMTEEWIYGREIAISGGIPVFIVPIPIPIIYPSGTRDTTIFFNHEKVVGVNKKYGKFGNEYSGCIFLPFFSPPCRYPYGDLH